MKISWRIWVLLIILVFSLLSIGFSFQKGVVIKSVERNSTAFNEGLRQGDIIKEINGKKIENKEDYTKSIDNIFASQKLLKGIQLSQLNQSGLNKTNQSSDLNDTLSEIKESESDLISVRIKTKDKDIILFDNEPPKIIVDNIPRTKIRTGLDISGGSRAVVKPERDLSGSEIDDLIAVTRNRLNVFGISDLTIRGVTDLAGNNFMMIEVAGATPGDLEELVAKQGKFEAKIGNETAFVGGKKDITNVCRNDASCSGIYSCDRFEQGNVCQFRFVIYLSEDAAKRHADITEKLDINITSDLADQYLEKPLDLYLDDNLVDSLLISENLKGRVTTQIQIQGSGTGTSQQEAYNEATAQMNKLQTVLITGSLPFKLEIVKLDSISPLLGEEFIRNILLAGTASIIAVSLIVFLRYRNIKVSLAILLTSFSEIVIILGIASFIKWNLDLPSIAGILVTIGTGVDQQIVIIDESRMKRQTRGLKERMKRAFFVVIAAFFTSVASLLPLNWAGGGLLRGFAITTIIGITAGILITRPAFIDIIKRIEEKTV
ncbi:PDZ domain-containing protein [Candidatus Pacearchaeota archaeon]|nr:PDZ domain-containing protein [Candidatus Pacearchaeota archaeon]